MLDYQSIAGFQYVCKEVLSLSW